jgi:hypothetical protein
MRVLGRRFVLDRDLSYFVRRAAEELIAAETATSQQAAEAHRELARRYTMMIDDVPGSAETATPVSSPTAEAAPS